MTKHPFDCEGCYCPIGCGGDPGCIDACLEHECGIIGGGLQAFQTGIQAGDVDPFALARNHMNVAINYDRQAVQLMGCDGRMLAHVTLAHAIVEASGQ